MHTTFHEAAEIASTPVSQPWTIEHTVAARPSIVASRAGGNGKEQERDKEGAGFHDPMVAGPAAGTGAPDRPTLKSVEAQGATSPYDDLCAYFAPVLIAVCALSTRARCLFGM